MDNENSPPRDTFEELDDVTKYGRTYESEPSEIIEITFLMKYKKALAAVAGLIVAVMLSLFLWHLFSPDKKVDDTTYNDSLIAIQNYYAFLLDKLQNPGVDLVEVGLDTRYVTNEFSEVGKSTMNVAVLTCIKKLQNGLVAQDILENGKDSVKLLVRDNTMTDDSSLYAIIMNKTQGTWKVHSADCS